MAKQIKAYVEIEPYVEVTQGRGSDPSDVLASVLVDDEFGDALVQLAQTATGTAVPARVVSGPRGCGKSTLLTTLAVLAGHAELRPRAPAGMRGATTYLSGARLVPIVLDPTEAFDGDDFEVALADAVATASAPASAA